MSDLAADFSFVWLPVGIVDGVPLDILRAYISYYFLTDELFKLLFIDFLISNLFI